MELRIKQTSAPATDPVTIAEAKAHLRVTHEDDDSYILSLITAAAQEVEGYLRRQLVTATWEWKLDSFPTEFRVPFPPLQSVTSIKYTDSSEVEQTVATTVYVVDTYSQPGRITLANGQSWPTDVFEEANVVEVIYVAGYGAASAVPQRIKQAIMILVNDMYVNREIVTDRPVSSKPFIGRLLYPIRALEAF